jgi:pimeloyl-ACP methyl ester carboxylesterase
MRRSSYMVAWQVPQVTEWALSRNDFALLRRFTAGRHPDIEVAIADLARPGRLTASLNWYRANLMPPKRYPSCTVPSLGIMPTEDKYVGERQMIRTQRYVDANWRMERLPGVGHWAPLEAPDQVAELALAWLD